MQKRYFVIPIHDAVPKKNCRICRDGIVVSDFDAAIDPVHPHFEAYVDVTRFGEGALTLVDADGNPVSYRESNSFPTMDEIPGGDVLRPAAHYTTTIGWTNDPNGLCYVNDKYHMFYQHNPMSHDWGNMTWGHAVSSDLVHWTEVGDALFPDELGTMFSGSAIVDEKNAAGFGEGAILLFYTAAGGNSLLSKGVPFSQCLAYSTDGGATFTKYDKNPIIPHMIGGNRDPKVQWSDELGKYTLSLYLDGHDYEIFTSDNLIDWEKWVDIHTPNDDECPDFYPLDVDGERKWVFSGAHDTYIIGVIRDGKFVVEQEELPYHIAPGVSYAAQTYSGTGKRRIKMAWGQNQAPGALFNSQMGIPVEMFLKRAGDKIRLGSLPVKEVERMRKNTPDTAVINGTCDLTIGNPAVYSDKAVDLTLEIGDDSADFTISCFGIEIAVSPMNNTYMHGSCTAPLTYTGRKIMRIIFDSLGAEIFADDGLVYSTIGQIADRTRMIGLKARETVHLRITSVALSMK